MGCCGSKPPEELPLSDLRALIEQAPPEKKEELERVAGLKEGLSDAATAALASLRCRDAVATATAAGWGGMSLVPS